MPPRQRSDKSVELKPDGFITTLRENRNSVRELKTIKKNLERSNAVYEDLMLEKQRELDQANMEIFFLKYNADKLKMLMAEINEKIVHCDCLTCYETGRANEAPFAQAQASICKFAPSWENILKKYQLKFEYFNIPADQNEEDFMRGMTTRSMGPRVMLDTDIVNVGHDDLWRNVALGRGLGRRDFRPNTTPRNKLRFLFNILDDYRVSDLAVVMDETPDDDTDSPVLNMAGPAARA